METLDKQFKTGDDSIVFVSVNDYSVKSTTFITGKEHNEMQVFGNHTIALQVFNNYTLQDAINFREKMVSIYINMHSCQQS